MTKQEQWEVEQSLLQRLQEEIHRIAKIERFSKSELALEALQLVSCWATEEEVENI